MGLPLTWPILSLIQGFCAESTIRRYRKVHGTERKRVTSVSICGDDLVAAWTKTHTAMYREYLSHVGLVENKKKAFLSAYGCIFVEKLFRRSKLMKRVYEKETKSKDNDTPATETTLWHYIQSRLRISSTEVVKTYHKVLYVQRPLLSAIVQAKRFARKGMVRPGRHQEDTPIHLTLGKCLTNESDRCSEPWRKAALLRVAESVHRTPLKAMRNSKVPLYWPTALGGWGLPGKQAAPVAFRKAAAVSLTGNETLMKSFSNIFITSAAPDRLRKRLKSGIALINQLPERINPSAVPKERTEVISDFTGRFLAFHSKDPVNSKILDKRYASVGATVKRIYSTMNSLKNRWKSVNPIKASKALALSQKFESQLVDSQYMEAHMAGCGIYDDLVRRRLASLNTVTFRPYTAESSNPEKKGSEERGHRGTKHWFQPLPDSGRSRAIVRTRRMNVESNVFRHILASKPASIEWSRLILLSQERLHALDQYSNTEQGQRKFIRKNWTSSLKTKAKEFLMDFFAALCNFATKYGSEKAIEQVRRTKEELSAARQRDRVKRWFRPQDDIAQMKAMANLKF